MCVCVCVKEGYHNYMALRIIFCSLVVTELENIVSVSVEAQKVYPGTGHMVSWQAILYN